VNAEASMVRKRGVATTVIRQDTAQCKVTAVHPQLTFIFLSLCQARLCFMHFRMLLYEFLKIAHF
jgi:hypothetical protein